MHCHQRIGHSKRRNHQIMLILIARRDDRIDTFRVRIKKLVGISFVLDLEFFDPVVSLVPDEDIQHDEMVEVVDCLVHGLRFVTHLDLFVLE